MLSRQVTIIAVAAVTSIGILAAANRVAEPRSMSDCPPAEDSAAAETDLSVCVDRGPDAVYMAGESITACVTANIPQIAIYPPPPPPTIRLINLTADGQRVVLLEEAFVSGSECITGEASEPFGQEQMIAEALGPDGQPFITASVSFTTRSS